MFNRPPDPVILAKLNSLANHIMEIRDTQRIQGEQLAEMQETQGRHTEQLGHQDTVLDVLTEDREARAAAELQRQAIEKQTAEDLASAASEAAQRFTERLDYLVRGIFLLIGIVFTAAAGAIANTAVQQAGSRREIVLAVTIALVGLGLAGLVGLYIRTSRTHRKP